MEYGRMYWSAVARKGAGFGQKTSINTRPPFTIKVVVEDLKEELIEELTGELTGELIERLRRVKEEGLRGVKVEGLRGVTEDNYFFLL